jgi:hypothetical protein
VVNELKKLGLGAQFTLLPLSAGSVIGVNGMLAAGDQLVISDPSRRRIEIRLRRFGE